jgi:hypothetical protein
MPGPEVCGPRAGGLRCAPGACCTSEGTCTTNCAGAWPRNWRFDGEPSDACPTASANSAVQPCPARFVPRTELACGPRVNATCPYRRGGDLCCATKLRHPVRAYARAGVEPPRAQCVPCAELKGTDRDERELLFVRGRWQGAGL